MDFLIEKDGKMRNSKTIILIISTIMILACPVIIPGCNENTREPGRAAESMEPCRIYVFPPDPDNFWPRFDYEGPGGLRECFYTMDEEETFHFSYSAISLPPGTLWIINKVNDLPEYRVFDFSGTLSRSGDHCVLEGDLQIQGGGQLVVDGVDDEVNLQPGMNHVKVEWSANNKGG